MQFNIILPSKRFVIKFCERVSCKGIVADIISHKIPKYPDVHDFTYLIITYGGAEAGRIKCGTVVLRHQIKREWFHEVFLVINPNWMGGIGGIGFVVEHKEKRHIIDL